MRNDAWTLENKRTDIPRAILQDMNGNAHESDHFLKTDNYIRKIEKIICSESMVKGVRRIRTRNIGNYYAVEADILMDGGLSVALSHAATQRVEKLLRGRYGQPTHIVIHVEPFS